MKSPFCRSFGPALVLAALAAAGCRSAPGDPNSHWNVDAVPQRVTKHFTGYRGPLDGSYVDYQMRKKMEIDLTLRRHFLNHNPLNPFQVEDPSVTQRRPPFGILPDPLHYFHLEAIAWGTVLLVWTGTFIPIPVDSLIATFTADGWEEFGDSFSDTFTGDEDERVKPPPPRKFKVKNR